MILLVSFGVSLLLCLLLASQYSPLRMLDEPNERSLHATPTPHTGGIAIVLAVLAAWAGQIWLYGMPETMRWIAISALLVAAISFIDDVRELSPVIRILVHALAAVLLLAGGFVTCKEWLVVLLAWLAIVWTINFYNFMDGMDGFAGGMTLFGFGFLASAGWLHGANEYATFASLVAAAALGFLVLNFPPAKIFMGDVGSATLGLLAAAFSLWGMHDGLFGWWFPLLVFSPFVVDATVTLVRRILVGERIWEAHRSHYYQRLVRVGWGHRKTVLAEYVVMLLSGLSALAALIMHRPAFIWLLLVAWSMIFSAIAWQVKRMEEGLKR